MTLKHFAALALAATLLAPAFASAQAVGSNFVTTTSAPSNVAYTGGTSNATLGTLTFTAVHPGTFQITSLPLTFSSTGGGSASNLSSCQLFNSSGTALNTNGNILNSISAGNTTLTLDAPLSVSSGSPVVLTVRCNISSATPSGSIFSLAGASPTLAASLSSSLTAFPSVTPGEINAPIAAITLNPVASGSNLNVTSLPLTVTYNGGLSGSYVNNCRITSSGSTLNVNSSGVLNSGANTLSFDVPLTAMGGASAMPLILSCNISALAPIGSNLGLSLAPSGILVSNPSNGSSVVATQGIDPTTGATLSSGGTVTVVGQGVPILVPPNTGAGAGAPLNLALLALAALVVLLGAGYVARQVRA